MGRLRVLSSGTVALVLAFASVHLVGAKTAVPRLDLYQALDA